MKKDVSSVIKSKRTVLMGCILCLVEMHVSWWEGRNLMGENQIEWEVVGFDLVKCGENKSFVGSWLWESRG